MDVFNHSIDRLPVLWLLFYRQPFRVHPNTVDSQRNFLICQNKFSYKIQQKQECIPVGCIPPALYRTGVSAQGRGLYLNGVSVGGGVLSVNRMTDACENITLPQTSFAGGNYTRSHLLRILLQRSSFFAQSLQAPLTTNNIFCIFLLLETVTSAYQ